MVHFSFRFRPALAFAVLCGLGRGTPALAQDLYRTLNLGLSFATIVGWGTRDLRTTIMLVINILMGFLGILALLVILYGVVGSLNAGGNEEKAAFAKKTMIAGFIGLAIIFAAFSIASFVVRELAQATG